MSKRKHNVTLNTKEKDWLRENVPRRTLTRWKKRKINRTLTDIEKHTAQRHEIDEGASQSEEQRAEPFTLTQEIDEDASQSEEQRAEPFTSTQEIDEDASQSEEQRAEPFTLTQEIDEDASQSEEQRAEPFTSTQEIDEDASQSEEQRAEPFTLTQEIDEDASQSEEQRAEPFTSTQEIDEDPSQSEEQRAEPFTSTQEIDEDPSQSEEQRAEPFTSTQDNVPQAIDDVHTQGLTEEQSCISILSFALRHNTTGVLMEDLLKLLKLHSAGTSAIPASKYFLGKPLAGIVDQFEHHHYCSVCTKYLGTSQSQEETLTCVSCSSSITVKASLHEGHFFISIPLKGQLKDILENQGMHDLCFPADDSSREVINDICDGTLYQALQSNSEVDFLSLTFNCDGVPVFQSSKFSIWPILCCVNEIPPQCRDKHVLLCALWFGSKKPDMTCFFKPFVEECANLSKTGFKWHHPIDQSWRNVKVHPLCCVCDAVARPLLQNFKQFNDEYGCGVCLHPGVQMRKGQGNSRVYTCSAEKPSDRNHKTTVEIGQIAEREGKTILGIKGPSAIVDLAKFDLINGMVPDYMHCVLLGVCRQMATLWIDSKSYSEPWYIGTQTAIMDRHLLSIKPPGIVARVPRSLTERKFWKAHEWQHWLLYYSLPVLKGILPQKYHSHWALLIEGISILLGSELSTEQINHAHDALVYFVGGVQALYGEEHMTFNVHSLLHLSQSVVHWGPLWAHSAFMFEAFNGYLLKQVKSSQAVPQQICKRVMLSRAFPRLAKQFLTNAPAEVKDFCNEMRTEKHHVKKFAKFAEVTALGPPNVRLISVGDQAALHTVKQVPTNYVVNYYKRIAVNAEVVHGHTYSKTKQRNNSIVLLKDGSIFRVSHFIDIGDQCLYAIGNYGKCTVQKLARGSLIKTPLSYMSTVHFPTGFHKAINTTQVVGPCMYIQCPQSSSFVCRLLKTYYCK
ncbi:uncharacterized protein LOC115575952 isoform X8 [Sparus aurata]|uniref:uncharacterized protein LOC115575952 isoform X8 n=1 Tax=Sparus aurata TaxID=8175 RepID=UPI0011C1B220|nr:uncharacterized protein LOC115575952 isoform X8 [Sparus aurata]